MDILSEPNAFEPIFDTISSSEIDKPEELEPESERDSEYYFDTVVFKVENTLFRVPKIGFQVADGFFETIFSLPQPEGKPVEGSDDTCPLLLVGVSKAYFRGFLRVLYPFHGATTPTYEEWVGALDLATMWDFKEIRKASVLALSPLITSKPIVENILLAKKYRVKKWLSDGYLRLIKQTEPLKIDELHFSNIDLLTIARLCSIREKIYCQQATCHCYYCGRTVNGISRPEWDSDNFIKTVVDPLIAQTFADEMKEMETFC